MTTPTTQARPGGPARPLHGARVRELRERRSWTQGVLCDRAGISRPALIRVENTGRCSLTTFRLIAEALDVPPGALLDDGPLYTRGEVVAAVRRACSDIAPDLTDRVVAEVGRNLERATQMSGS